MDAVTVTANSWRTLERLLTCEPLRASFDRIVVVDANSADGSAERAEAMGAVVVRLRRPSGYGASVNAGARLTQGEAFAVLNPDITFSDPHLPVRLERWLSSPRIGVAAPALILPNGSLQDSARYFPTLRDLVVRRRVNPEEGAIRTSGIVPWVVGAFMVVRREAWAAVGGFDERYFMYFDDVDLCWRMKRAGWHTSLDCSVKAYHEHMAASRAPLWTRRTRWHVASA